MIVQVVENIMPSLHATRSAEVVEAACTNGAVNLPQWEVAADLVHAFVIGAK